MEEVTWYASEWLTDIKQGRILVQTVSGMTYPIAFDDAANFNAAMSVLLRERVLTDGMALQSLYQSPGQNPYPDPNAAQPLT